MSARIALAIAMLVAAPAAWAQAAQKIQRICVIFNTVPAAELNGGPFSHPGPGLIIDVLRERGWVEGRNLAITWKSAEGDYSRWPALVDECLRMRPDVLVVSHPQSARIAADRTRTIPIVFMNAWGLGHEKLIASHARPGGNVTGVAIMNLGAALDGKRTALLKAAAPAVTKVGILWHREAGGLQDIALDDRWPRQARTLALSYVSLPFEDVSNLESVIGEAVKQGVNGLIVGSLSSMIWPDFQRRLHAIVERHRLPAMHELLSAAETGGLMAYAPDFDDNIRRSTYLVDKILRGAKPGDLPVEQPSQLRLYLNVKAARAIGLAFSPSLLAQADRVIE